MTEGQVIGLIEDHKKLFASHLETLKDAINGAIRKTAEIEAIKAKLAIKDERMNENLKVIEAKKAQADLDARASVVAKEKAEAAEAAAKETQDNASKREREAEKLNDTLAKQRDELEERQKGLSKREVAVEIGEATNASNRKDVENLIKHNKLKIKLKG